MEGACLFDHVQESEIIDISPVHPQKGNMSNVQPVVVAESIAWSAVSAKDTYGSLCGVMSMPYAMLTITCPTMLQGDIL